MILGVHKAKVKWALKNKLTNKLAKIEKASNPKRFFEAIQEIFLFRLVLSTSSPNPHPHIQPINFSFVLFLKRTRYKTLLLNT